MKKFIFFASIVMCLFLSTNASAQVTNGSFEAGTCNGTFTTVLAGQTNITGWTVGGHSVDYICSYWQASDGNRSIDLNGNGTGSLSQTIATIPGVTYGVYFDMSGNPDGPPDERLMAVSATGTASEVFSYTADNNTHADMQWASESYQFAATSSSTLLSFVTNTLGFYGPALDNVEVIALFGQVCHRNNGKAPFKTLTIDPESVPDHLGHGDQPGPCPTPES